MNERGIVNFEPVERILNKIYSPAKGEWTGKLKAGGFPIEIEDE